MEEKLRGLIMKYTTYNGEWPWENFKPVEVACKCCGELWEGNGKMPDTFRTAMDNLQRLRDLWDEPIIINSGHRCAKHNKEVGGVSQSQHLTIAFDCRCKQQYQNAFCKLAKRSGFTTAVPYPDNGFCHLDMGRPRTW